MYDELVRRLRAQADAERYFVGEDMLYDKAADVIEELQSDNAALSGTVSNLIGQIAELSKPRWIPVTERLPEDRQSVLVHRDDGGIFIFEYFTTSPTDECWIDDHLNVYSAYCVTHWMPLPEPPKGET